MGKTGLAKLKVIREGYFRWIEKLLSSEVTCTTTYIEDGGKKVIVDVANTGEEQALLTVLKNEKIDPNEIDFVVLTHSHPDHVGCLHLFPKAEYIGAGVRWKGSRHEYWHGETLALTDDIYVLRTPGHTVDSCSVIANTASGVVAMVGDLWWALNDPKLLVVSNEAELKRSRKKIIELAEYIVPGHDKMSKVVDAKL